MKKPLALDLCCGLGGWTHGLLAAGWDIISIDIDKEYEGECPGFFMQADIRDICGPMKDITNGRNISLVVASPPCQEFSYRHLPFGRAKNLPPPDKSIWQACERIAAECNAPLILENVIGAQKFMGRAKAHYGSYYLWGDVPALLPIGQPVKGFSHASRKIRIGKNQDEYLKIQGPALFSSKSPKRKAWSANAARIPFELARWIGECFK